MSEAIPFVGAGIGFLVGGPFGAQVGWMVGAGIYSAVQPAQRISAGDPSAAPSVGSDMRGQTIPVIYGTVRSPGYLLWQDNFKSVKRSRKVGSGKKKAKQEYYQYYWDFLFYCGFTTREYKILGIWEGSERIADVSLQNITFADGDTFEPAKKQESLELIWSLITSGALGGAFGFLGNAFKGLADQLAINSAIAGRNLDFSEAYFYGGHGTDDPEDGWAHFQSEAVAPDVRWPHQVWCGFKQIDLGEQPRIPQLNFEIGPKKKAQLIPIYYDTTVTEAWPEDPENGFYNTAPLWVTLGGKHALFENISTFSGGAEPMFASYDTRTGKVKDSRTRSEVRTEWNGLGVATYWMEIADYVGTVRISGTNDFAAIFSGLEENSGVPGAGANDQYFIALVYELNEETGTFGAVGWSVSTNFNLPIRIAADMLDAVITHDKKDVYYFWNSIVGAGTTCYVRHPYPRANSFANGSIFVPARLSSMGNVFMQSNYTDAEYYIANRSGRGMAVPMLDGEVRYYAYINKAQCDFYNDGGSGNGQIEVFAASNPNGFMMYSELPGIWELCNADFDSFAPPFDNEGENNDGTTANPERIGYTEYLGHGPLDPTNPDSDWVVIFSRDVSNAYNTSKGISHSYRVYLLDRTTGGFEALDDHEVFQELEDVVEKYPAIVTDTSERFEHSRDEFKISYSPITGEIWRMHTLSTPTEWRAGIALVGRIQFGLTDLTPPEIIYDIFTNDVVGFGQPATAVNQTSYAAAVAYCRERGIYVSGIFNVSREHIQVFEQLVNIYSGWVAWNGVQLKFGIPTESFVSVGTIDNSCFIQENPDQPKPSLNGARQALQDTSNKITVRYYDRALSYRTNEVTLADEVDIDLNGVRHKQLHTGLVMDKEIAYRVAEPMLWGNLYGRNIYSNVLVGWKCAKFEPGDLITLIDSLSNTNVQVRLTEKREISRGKFKMTFVEELDYLGDSRPYVEEPKPTPRALITATEIPLLFNAYELPAEFQKEGPAFYIGWAPGGPSASAGLYTSPSTTDFRLQDSTLPFPDNGIFLTLLPNDPTVIQNAQVKINVASFITPSSAFTWGDGELEDFSEFDRALGLSTLWVGSEMVAYEGATLIDDNVYQFDKLYRGWGGTKVAVHSPGAAWWRHDGEDGGGLFRIPYTTNEIGTSFFYKVVPVGFDGRPLDVNSVEYKQYTIRGDHYGPRGIQNNALRILVGSPETAPASLASLYGAFEGTSLHMITPFYTRAVGSGEQRNVMAQWPEASQLSGYGVQGYGVPSYGSFQEDQATVSWLVNVVGSGGLVVHSTTVTTPFYSYDAAQNEADNGAWRGNIAISVLPRNAYADAPFSAVASLDLQG